MQKYVMEGFLTPAEGMGLGATGRHVYLAEDVDAYRNTTHEIIDANGRALTAMASRITDLEQALRWALGENGDFEPLEDEPLRPDGHPVARYWWRSELRLRAGLGKGEVP